MNDHDVLRRFAESVEGRRYRPLIDLCNERGIPLLEGKNFDGVLEFQNEDCIIPIEHTKTLQHPADPLLAKISAGQKVKGLVPGGYRDIFVGTVEAVQKKRENSEGYSKWVPHLKKHGISCSQSGILFVERYDPYLSALYDNRQFQEDFSLLKGSVLLEDPEHQDSFFQRIYFGAWVCPVFGAQNLCSGLIWESPLPTEGSSSKA